jgi:hypothetical protein
MYGGIPGINAGKPAFTSDGGDETRDPHDQKMKIEIPHKKSRDVRQLAGIVLFAPAKLSL